MKRIKKPAGEEPAGTDRDRTKNGQKSKGYCTSHNNQLSSPAPDYLCLMHKAQADFLAAFAGFLAGIEAENG